VLMCASRMVAFSSCRHRTLPSKTSTSASSSTVTWLGCSAAPGRTTYVARRSVAARTVWRRTPSCTFAFTGASVAAWTAITSVATCAPLQTLSTCAMTTITLGSGLDEPCFASTARCSGTSNSTTRYGAFSSCRVQRSTLPCADAGPLRSSLNCCVPHLYPILRVSYNHYYRTRHTQPVMITRT